MKLALEDRIVKFASRCVKVCTALPAKKIGSSSIADQLSRILSASVITARNRQGQ